MSSAGLAWETLAPDRDTERARDFRFDVAWSVLSALREPLQTADQIFAAAAELMEAPAKPMEVVMLAPSSLPALAIVEKRPAPKLIPEFESSARWEMVVPKMARPTRPAISAPPPPLLSRAVTAISVSRELSLAKIVRAALGRLKPAELTLAVQRPGKRAGIL
jgi:hypothetical protein